VETDWHVRLQHDRGQPSPSALDTVVITVGFYSNFRETPTRLTLLCVANHLKRKHAFHMCRKGKSADLSRALPVPREWKLEEADRTRVDSVQQLDPSCAPSLVDLKVPLQYLLFGI
jgi:hypothetical protein